MEDYYGLIELLMVFLALAGGWVILERQGKRLDRQRDERKARETDPPRP